MIGEKIYNLRKDNKLSQEQLAEKVNVTRQTVSNWETSQTVPDAYQLLELSKVFEISVDEILNNNKIYNKEINYDFVLNEVKKSIKIEISSVSYDTWFSSIDIYGIEGDKIILLVPMEFHATFIKNNYNDLLLKTFNDFLTKQIRKIEFKVFNKF